MPGSARRQREKQGGNMCRAFTVGSAGRDGRGGVGRLRFLWITLVGSVAQELLLVVSYLDLGD